MLSYGGETRPQGELTLRLIHGRESAETIKAPLTLQLLRQRMAVVLAGLRIWAALKTLGPNGMVLRSELRLRKYDSYQGVWIDYGVVSKRLVTNAGVEFLVDDWDLATTDQTNFNSHGYGTGIVAEAVGDTALGTEVETPRGAGTKSQPTANQLRTVQTHTFAASFAITEHGLFSAATAGTLWDRSVFAAINVVANDSIEATYTCTINSGG